jgi:hypothetical protein
MPQSCRKTVPEQIMETLGVGLALRARERRDARKGRGDGEPLGSLHRATHGLHREQIKLQVALITPLSHVKGYAAAETRAAAERARLLIEQAEALESLPMIRRCCSGGDLQ